MMINEGEKRLYIDALNEIAEHLGHSLKSPISISLLCLEFGITNDQKGKIYVAFNQILQKYSFDDLEVKFFKDAVIDIVPEMDKYDNVIKALIKAFAENLIFDLLPFARTMDD